jgi:hypothetical protein
MYYIFEFPTGNLLGFREKGFCQAVVFIVQQILFVPPLKSRNLLLLIKGPSPCPVCMENHLNPLPLLLKEKGGDG